MIVEVTAQAEANLEEIGDFIAQHNPARTITFVQDLRDKCLDLAQMPLAFPLVPRYERYERYGVRRRAYRHYLILCTERKQTAWWSTTSCTTQWTTRRSCFRIIASEGEKGRREWPLLKN